MSERTKKPLIGGDPDQVSLNMFLGELAFMGQEDLELDKYLEKSSVVQEAGDSEHDVMSQKAVTDELDTKVGINTNQTITGLKIFSAFPITPTEAPTANYQVANKKYVDDSVLGAVPIGMCYTQYPGTDTPSTLFGGTWTLMFNSEGVFFRTEGQGASSFGGGVQGDAIRNINGQVTSIWGRESTSGTGPFSIGDKVEQTLAGGTNRNDLVRIDFNASSQVPTASENRPRNRTVRVWRKTAH